MSADRKSSSPEGQALYVVGVGLVSPAGFSAADHTFFVRAGLVQPVPSPFLDENDEPIPCAYCPWLPSNATLAERVEQLAFGAASEALEPMQDQVKAVHVSLVTSGPTPEFSEQDAANVGAGLKSSLGAESLTRFRGAAAVHQALIDARERLSSGGADAVCIVGADSSFSVPRVAAAYRRRRVVWVPLEPPPSEAAGAVMLMTRPPPTVRPLARFLDALTTLGTANDYNDEPTDGVGLTFLFRKLPNRGGVPMVFGPMDSERLRRRDWRLAAARVRRHLGSPYAHVDIETAIGQVGAAGGAVHLAYAVACCRFQTIDPQIPPGSPFYAWAISSDGLRGLAVLEGAAQ
jgi:hypothetical protein